MINIKTDNEIELKEISIESAPVIFEAIDNNRKYLREWLPFIDSTSKVEDTENFIISVLQSRCHKEDKVFEIWHKKEFSGLVSLKEIDRTNNKTELGFWLVEDKQGKGIMIRSCRSLIKYAFEKLNMNKVMVKCAVGNKKSIQIPFRLKLEYEGVERQGELLNSKYVDLKTYSILKKEWNRINKKSK